MLRRSTRPQEADAIGALAQALKESEAELVASAARFRTLVQNSGDLTLVVDDAGRISFVSPASRSVLGMAEEDLAGTEVMDLVHPDERHRVEAALLRPTATTKSLVECRMRHADHTWRGVDVTVVDLRADATVGGVVLHIRDVTDRRRLETDLRQAQKLESVGQLAAGVAHEINTPIQFIANNLQFLLVAFGDLQRIVARLDPSDAQVANALELLDEVPVAIKETLAGTTRGTEIVRAMKAFSHSGGEAMAPADINEAVRTTLVVAHNEVKYVANVTLDLAEMPLVTCHIGDINQVLLNLIVNAAHAIGDVSRRTGKKGRITIRTSVAGDDAVIEIADTGPGIPVGIADRVFEPFFTTKEVGVGTGQGLALAYTVIHDRHRGNISFASDAMSGTTFTLRIPIAGTVTP